MDDERETQQEGVGAEAEWFPRPHPVSALVVRVAYLVGAFTPCHGGQVFYNEKVARPGAVLVAICARCQQRWELELVPDEDAEGGLRPKWSERADVGGR